MTPFTRGFRRRHPEAPPGVELPPGPYLTEGFPVLSAGPTPDIPLAEGEFAISRSATAAAETPGVSSATRVTKPASTDPGGVSAPGCLRQSRSAAIPSGPPR